MDKKIYLLSALLSILWVEAFYVGWDKIMELKVLNMEPQAVHAVKICPYANDTVRAQIPTILNELENFRKLAT